MPVNVRQPEEHLHLGNRVSMLIAPLPVGIFDPLERLRQVRTATAQLYPSINITVSWPAVKNAFLSKALLGLRT